MVACEAGKFPHWLRLWPQQGRTFPRAWKRLEGLQDTSPSPHWGLCKSHCQLGRQGDFTGKIEGHKGSKGERESGGLAGSGALRTGQLPAVAEATQSISGLRGQGKTVREPKSRDSQWLFKARSEAHRKVSLGAEGIEVTLCRYPRPHTPHLHGEQAPRAGFGPNSATLLRTGN